MINIVFEGAPGAGKTTIINEVVKKLKSFGIKVENTVDIDPTTPLYPILHNMNCTTPLITSNIEFSTVLYETFIQTADYFYIKERILKQNNEINIFDRFYIIDKSRNKETDRVGLGLAIAKSIANMNGAEIKLESKQGKDSTFTIFFKESLVH